MNGFSKISFALLMLLLGGTTLFLLKSNPQENTERLGELIQNMPRTPQQSISHKKSPTQKSPQEVVLAFSKTLEQSNPSQSAPQSYGLTLSKNLRLQQAPLLQSLGTLLLLALEPDTQESRTLRSNGVALRATEYLNQHPLEALREIYQQTDQLDPKDTNTRLAFARGFQNLQPKTQRPQDLAQEITQWTLQQPWETRTRNQELVTWIETLKQISPSLAQQTLHSLYEKNGNDFKNFLSAQFDL